MTLAESYAACRTIARQRAKNFYYSFVLLSPDQKNAMCAVYAFMRYCDDLSDGEGATVTAIERWRDALTQSLAGRPDGHPIWPAFEDTVKRFRIPHKYFYDMIDGVLSDLTPRRIVTFGDLYQYCYCVASVVGLTTVHIFGYERPEALALAEKCGVAFQLTNILRDIKEDFDLGRQYLPEEDLDRFGVSAAELRAGVKTDAFIRLMEFETARAKAYYDQSAPLLGMVHRNSRASLWALITIYSKLLDRIKQSNYDVLSRRIALPRWEKGWIVVRAAVMG